MVHNKDKARFTEALLQWFAANMRALPWRKDYSPYRVWVSEIMLQQTQMERGVTYFTRWMQRFPDVRSVAEAEEDAILKAWEGLGYYSRARNLHKAAKKIMTEFAGVFPADYDAIRSLPGIGDYTAGAIASIAFQQNYVAVDANVERVFSRLFDIDTPIKQKENIAFVHRTAQELLPDGKARHFNQALMELGALVCSKKARCEQCPVQEWCEAYRLGIPHERPVTAPRKAIVSLEVATGLLEHEGHIFIQKRPEMGVWAGFWEFPGGSVEEGETPEQAICREFMEEMEFDVTPREKIAVVRHGYTTYRVNLHCYLLGLKNGNTAPVLHAATESRWVRFDELDAFTFPAGHRKLIDLLRGGLQWQWLREAG
ncbi:A/G-specific adenine glycosylase [Oleidesulfovibrio sp.]|uniref:A/G-specific adenine glycosylase n=1 Tax=Oleidesulfovibrio sp. TaxID=2909707 RepID=UPI003A8AED44